MAQIAVIIVNYNGKEDTIECLNSLATCHSVSFTPIVVDNGSTDGSVATLSSHFPSLHLIRSETNLGFAGGNNLGITYALEQGFSHLCLLNNDTTVAPSFLSALASSYKEHSILGAKLINAKNHALLDHLGGIWNADRLEFDLVGAGANAALYKNKIQLDYVCGCALFASRSVFERVGFLYEPFFLYWEESDFCMRAKKAGILSYSCPDALVYHKGAIAPEKKSSLTSYYAQRNRLLFLSRNISLTSTQKKTLRKILFRKCKHFLLHILQLPFSKKKKRIVYEWAEIRGIIHGIRGRYGKL